MEELNYDALGLLASLLAIIISAVSLIRSRNTQKAFLEFERVHAELSAKQLQEMDDLAAARVRANVEVYVIDGSVYLTNNSSAIARDINVHFNKDEDNYIIKSEFEMLPYEQLNPGQEIKLIGSYNTSEAPRSFSIKVTWLNEDDSNGVFSGVIQS